MADLDASLRRITSAHRGKPRFMATAAALVEGLAALGERYRALPAAFDLEEAIGAQLDAVGLWVGITRHIRTPITGVYFTLDADGLGLDQGIWQGPFDPSEGITSLDDDTFRLLIRAKIGANHWDGTLEGAVPVFNLLFNGDTHVFIQDNQDMSMDVAVSGRVPSALFLALLTGGYLPIKPAGVRVNYYVLPSGDGPQFGFDVENQYISGFDDGLWGTLISAQAR
ncbi:Putative bacteriophage protein [plant metagenome]|uniref:Bacteriophage protein n=1 Tax=plant metagenome TaxID=1297885 RepID=A0A484QHC0_9ZZZZ